MIGPVVARQAGIQYPMQRGHGIITTDDDPPKERTSVGDTWMSTDFNSRA